MAGGKSAADVIEEKREAAIAKKEADRLKRIEDIKAVKIAKASERAEAEAAKDAERQKEEERLAKLGELERRRQENIAKKEAAHKARASELKARKQKGKGSAKYAKSDVILLKQVYDQYDADRSGSVSVTELQSALKTSALAGSSDAMLAELDRNGDGSVEFPELLKLLYPLANKNDISVMLEWVAPPPPPPPPPKRELSAAQLEEIRAIFALYDKDGSGTLTVKELKVALKGTFLEEEEIDAMFVQADVDENKLLDLAEFRALMVSTGLWDVDTES